MSFKISALKAILRLYNAVKTQKKEIKTLALISNTAIGDTLMATPVFRAVKEAMPNLRVVAALNPSNAPLFETNPYIDEVVLYDGKWRGFLKALAALRRFDVDAALLLHSNEPQATPLAVLCGAGQIIKIPNDKNPFASFHSNPKTASPAGRHGVFDRLEQLKFIGVESNNPKMELFVKEESVGEAKEFLRQNGFDGSRLIGFQIGASTKSRMWFEDRWISLAKLLLAENQNIKIILTGSPSERAAAQKIKESLPQSRVVNAAGALRIGAAAALIGELDVFVTPDTGPMHIAIALGVPSVALFAVADPTKSGAAYDKEIHIEIKKPRTCEPCVSKLCKYQECMLQIGADEVFLSIESLINRRG